MLFSRLTRGYVLFLQGWPRTRPWWPWALFHWWPQAQTWWPVGADVVRCVAGLRPPPTSRACAAQSTPHPVPRWVRPPHRRPLRSRFVTGPPSLPLLPAAPARPVSSPPRATMRAPWMPTGRRGRARRPPRPIQPTAPPGLGGRDLRSPGRGQGDRRPAGCRLGPALAALPLAQRWMGRGLAPWSRRAGRRSVAPPRRERSTCGMIEVGKFRNVDCKCNSKTPPNRRDATTPGVMAGAATTGATAGTPDEAFLPRTSKHF